MDRVIEDAPTIQSVIEDTPTIQSVTTEAESTISSEQPIRWSRKRKISTSNEIHAISSDEEIDPEKPVETSGRLHPEVEPRLSVCEAPVFYPTEEEFKDTLAYIAKIREEGERYGICRIVPPPSWKPPCRLKEKNIWHMSKFSTSVQQVDKLQHRNPIKRNNMRKGKKKTGLKLKTIESIYNSSSEGSDASKSAGSSSTDEKFGFTSGPVFTLEGFQKYADKFKDDYFGIKDDVDALCVEVRPKQMPSIEAIEAEYWRIVEKPTETIEVYYGSDLETVAFGSGFPKALYEINRSDLPINKKVTKTELLNYIKSGWNLNNLARLPGSLFCNEEKDISGVLVPWLYFGMCFSSFCWHTEDHHLYSLNYLHCGEPKIWYGVPGDHSSKLENAMKQNLRELFEEQPNLLHEMVTQLSPSVLISGGAPVYRVVQHSGEFVLTFPRAYHSGFNCGFNCAEAVNVAPVDWLLHGQSAVEIYREQCRKTSLSHDKLLFGAARDAVLEMLHIREGDKDPSRWGKVCGKYGLLTEAIKTRLAMEQASRNSLPNTWRSQRMEVDFDSTHERECFNCFYDLHLSASSCNCSPDRFACLKHANLFCSCESRQRIFLYRYSIDELQILLEALEGQVDSFNKWMSMEISGVGAKSLNPCASSPRKGGKMSESEPLETNKNTSSGAPCQFVHNSSEATQLAMTNSLRSADAKKEGKKRILYQQPSSKRPNETNYSVDLNSLIKLDGHDSKMKETSENPNESSGVVHTISYGNGNEAVRPDSSSNIQSVPAQYIPNFHPTYPKTLASALSSSFENRPSSSRNSDLVAIFRGTKQFGVHLSGSNACSTGAMNPENLNPVTSTYATANLLNNCSPIPNLHVDVLNIGVVKPESKWCSRQVIFPKGFKSRVSFFDMYNPSEICHYDSEILDGGPFGPIFKVTMRKFHFPSFQNFSAQECWENVLQTINEGIIAQKRLENEKFLMLKPLDNINGLQMFGLLSPTIVQAIKALDPEHTCSEYWNHQAASSAASMLNRNPKADVLESSLEGLFKKASRRELRAMERVLSSQIKSNDWSSAYRILIEQIRKKC